MCTCMAGSSKGAKTGTDCGSLKSGLGNTALADSGDPALEYAKLSIKLDRALGDILPGDTEFIGIRLHLVTYLTAFH